MDAIPRGANFARIKMLWEIGVHVALVSGSLSSHGPQIVLRVGAVEDLFAFDPRFKHLGVDAERIAGEHGEHRQRGHAGADAQREYRDGDGREAGRFPEHPDAVAEIL